MLVWRKINELSSISFETVVIKLLILALFFTMRSCEYLEMRYQEESKQTKISRCENIEFKKKRGKLVSFRFFGDTWENRSNYNYL